MLKPSSNQLGNTTHLLSELRDAESPVLLGAARGQRCKPHHERVKTREWNEIHSKLPETRVQLTGEPQTACCTRHSCWYQMIQITNCINTENKIKHTKKNTRSLGNTWVNHGSIKANPSVAPVHPMSCSTLPSLCLHCQQSNISHDMSKPLRDIISKLVNIMFKKFNRS